MLTQERLKQLLHYDPETGHWTWRVSARGISAGKRAGTCMRGYNQIMIDRVAYLGHRLAWLYMTGHWPAHDIDHKNLKRGDNRWCNLREATDSQNHANTLKPKNNTSGFKGVRFEYNGYRARIKVHGKLLHLGIFPTAEEASIAYQKAAKLYHGEYANAGT